MAVLPGKAAVHAPPPAPAASAMQAWRLDETKPPYASSAS
jgi:hypothetical protein